MTKLNTRKNSLATTRLLATSQLPGARCHFLLPWVQLDVEGEDLTSAPVLRGMAVRAYHLPLWASASSLVEGGAWFTVGKGSYLWSCLYVPRPGPNHWHITSPLVLLIITCSRYYYWTHYMKVSSLAGGCIARTQTPELHSRMLYYSRCPQLWSL